MPAQMPTSLPEPRTTPAHPATTTSARHRTRLATLALLLSGTTTLVSGCAQDGAQYLGRWQHHGTMINDDNSQILDITRNGHALLISVYDPPSSPQPSKRLAAEYTNGHLTVAGPPPVTITYLEDEDAILAGEATFSRLD